MKFLYVLLPALLVAAPAVAQQAVTAPRNGQQASGKATESNANQAPQEERRICRRVESDTGSRMASAQRVCMTAREWQRYDREAEE
jgi:hypothetical protein